MEGCKLINVNLCANAENPQPIYREMNEFTMAYNVTDVIPSAIKQVKFYKIPDERDSTDRFSKTALKDRVNRIFKILELGHLKKLVEELKNIILRWKTL